MFTTLPIETPAGESLVDITAQVANFVTEAGIKSGLCAVVVPHTTAAITVNSALDPATAADILDDLKRLVPKRVDFQHQYDTPADAAGHIKAALIGHSITLIIHEGKLLLGGSQSILFCEFDGPRQRKAQVKLVGG